VILKQGLHGEDVKKIQHQLRQFQPALQVDGVFGPRTEQAVRVAQGRLVLYPPDGIAGLQTFAALDRRSRRVPERSDRPARPAGSGDPGALRPVLDPARKRAQQSPETDAVKRNPATMHVSLKGRQFIVRYEGQPGVGHRLHHPTAASGVTIGPSYEMKDRTQNSIASDLVVIGVAPDVAAKAAQGAGKQGVDSLVRRRAAETKPFLYGEYR
jgi:peptidoglycan hydrolase-like protein with peptidoglycan-binding domain